MNEYIKLILGYIFLFIFPIIIIIIIIDKIMEVIKTIKKGYKKVNGKVVGYINDNSDEYIESEKQRLLKKNNKYFTFLVNLANKYDDKSGKKGPASYLPIIEYQVNGKKYKINGNISRDHKGKLGKIKKVKYDPKNPSEAILIGDWNRILGILVMLLFTLMGYILVNY